MFFGLLACQMLTAYASWVNERTARSCLDREQDLERETRRWGFGHEAKSADFCEPVTTHYPDGGYGRDVMCYPLTQTQELEACRKQLAARVRYIDSLPYWTADGGLRSIK